MLTRWVPKFESTLCWRLIVNAKSPPLAKLVLITALLTGVGAMAQTTSTSTNLEAQASKTQNFAGKLAKADWAKKGVSLPSKTQLDASTQHIQGMRASGMGWGEIANSLGLRLGDVVSAANRNKHADDAKHPKSEKTESQRAEHADNHDGNHGGGGSSGRGGSGAGGNGGGHK